MKTPKGSGYDAFRIPLVSPEQIWNWSNGEVTKPKTIDNRTLRPVKNGLFCERIFGPMRDWECSCGKWKGERYKGIVCDRCAVEVAPASVRWERLGHIELAVPVADARFAKVTPSPMALLLGTPQLSLERVIYFYEHIVISVDEERRRQAIGTLEEEAHQKTAQMENSPGTEMERMRLRAELQQRLKDIEGIRPPAMLSENRYQELRESYDFFRAGMGAEALLEILKKLDLQTLRAKLMQETSTGQQQEAASRLQIVESFLQAEALFKPAGAKPEWMVLTALPVLPAGRRPVVQGG